MNNTTIQELHCQRILQFENIEKIKLEKDNLAKQLLHLEKNSNCNNEIQLTKQKIYELQCLENNVNEYIFSNYNLLNLYEEIENTPKKKKSSTLCDVLSKKNVCENNNISEKSSIIDEYLINNNKYNKNVKYKQKKTVCNFCHNKIINKEEDNETMTCTFCGNITTIFKEEFKINKNENLIVRNSIYLRKNHFREWLNHLQGKCNDSKKISPNLISIIEKEMKSMKIQNNKLTKEMLRKILKKNKLNKYYDHEIQILYLINGKKPLLISKETEILLTEYFEMTEIAFEAYKKTEKGKSEEKSRKNLLRYSYILYKLCELLELDEYLSHFSLLKDRLKKLEQDKIWKYICEYNNWTFYNTV